jgi:dTDP-4-dehydrorhamnose 3,5-epimerase
MDIQTTPLKGLLVLSPKKFGDARGWFMESFSEAKFDAATRAADGQTYRFVQDNHSYSSHGVLRGLHYQLEPHAQGKLVRVTQGAVWDVALDIREGSPTLGQWFGIELTADNQKQLWIPPGFAHGFVCLSESCDFLYKTTSLYAPQAERCIAWNEPSLQVGWPLDRLQGEPLISAKDAVGASFAQAPRMSASAPA